MFPHFFGGFGRRIASLIAASAIAATTVVATAPTASADDLDRTSNQVVAQIEAEPWPHYERGDRSVDIQAARKLLAYHGYRSDSTTSWFFNLSLQQTILRYQAANPNHLAETGELDDETWLLLRERTFGEFGPNSRGLVVEMIQSELNAKFDAGLTVDGRYGTRTTNAVRAAQRDFGIGVDGIVGRLTFRALITYQP
ncbi:peptidoglycan-binding domain-containing protein [Nocardiopsis sp. CT-R113]|uniref:Peptidoglycan-binding domain-containing protein n=1 Tax=Nocardiopsis codii TaxID=3065942 RepID=A0ABU7K8C2_9ACTN|nr:peptidoglycan-binding domain-containing protein [Nocardiopsis sp. CT-R113]MEE2038494.1 peptidoglycan-binding domain-containing protein [Nocardiopsis sp. CT-R113]